MKLKIIVAMCRELYYKHFMNISSIHKYSNYSKTRKTFDEKLFSIYYFSQHLNFKILKNIKNICALELSFF